jgi:type III secretory pathway component EscR
MGAILPGDREGGNAMHGYWVLFAVALVLTFFVIAAILTIIEQSAEEERVRKAEEERIRKREYLNSLREEKRRKEAEMGVSRTWGKYFEGNLMKLQIVRDIV